MENSRTTVTAQHVIDQAVDLYSVLDPDKKEIRVLKLQPGDQGDSICCNLQSACLVDGPSCDYETISYVWGDQSLRGSVDISGRLKDVPASTEIVLKRLRHTDRERTVWIDSLCINQDDAQERNSQVALMAEIYTHTIQNLIWLGPDEKGDSEESIQAIHAVLKDMKNEVHDLKEFLMSNNLAHHFSTKPIIEPVNWPAFSRFFESSWFERLWVIQEASLPARNICFRGASQISFDDVMKASFWYNHKSFATITDEGDDLPGFYCALNMLDFADEDCGRHRLRSLTDEGMALDIFRLEPRPPKTTDIRDHIYGKLGLYKKLTNCVTLPSELIPNYSLSYMEIYSQAARSIILTDADLAVLEQTWFGVADRGSDLPSWVPAWHAGRQDIDFQPFRFEYQASAHGGIATDCSTVKDPDDNSILTVSGINVGTIAHVSTMFIQSQVSDWDEGYDAMYYWKRPFEILDNLLSTYEPHQLRSSMHTSFHTLTAGWNGNASQCDVAHSFELCDALCELLYKREQYPVPTFHLSDDADTLQINAAYCCQALYSACANRRLFITNTGHIGLGPPEMEQGDVATVLFGCRYPLVLRPLDLEKGSYKLIGSCFISEIMNGEAVEEWKARGDAANMFHLH